MCKNQPQHPQTRADPRTLTHAPHTQASHHTLGISQSRLQSLHSTDIAVATPPCLDCRVVYMCMQVLDLGCADGPNSILPVKVILNTLEERMASTAADTPGGTDRRLDGHHTAPGPPCLKAPYSSTKPETLLAPAPPASLP